MPKQAQSRPVDVYFDKYSESHQNHTNEIIHWICVPAIVFSLFGLIWAIPFPYLEFMGKYNGYVNWASFLIAFAIYYYYKLSPVLSYFMLLLIMLFSAGGSRVSGRQRIPSGYGLHGADPAPRRWLQHGLCHRPGGACRLP